MLGPNEAESYERALSVVADIRIPARDAVAIVDAVSMFVRGAARDAAEAASAEEATVETELQWWTERDALLNEVMTPERFPTLTRLAAGGGFDVPPDTEGLQTSLHPRRLRVRAPAPARWHRARPQGPPGRVTVDPGDLHVVDNIGHAVHVADDPEDLVEDVDRLDLAGHVNLRAGDGDPQPVTRRDVGRSQRLDDVGAQLVVARREAVVDLDVIAALELAGIGRIGPGGVDPGPLARFREHALGRGCPGRALLSGDERIVGDVIGWLAAQIALVLRRERQPEALLVHASAGGKLRAGSISR